MALVTYDAPYDAPEHVLFSCTCSGTWYALMSALPGMESHCGLGNFLHVGSDIGPHQCPHGKNQQASMHMTSSIYCPVNSHFPSHNISAHTDAACLARPCRLLWGISNVGAPHTGIAQVKNMHNILQRSDGHCRAFRCRCSAQEHNI